MLDIKIEENKDLKPYTTFGIEARARYFAEYSSERELLALSRTEEFLNNEVLNIGGGSNLLFIHDFDGLVLHSCIKGIKQYVKDAETTFVIAGAGEKWTDLVDYCVSNGLAGLENLAGIPGEVGASAIQNVGAYGVEAGDIIHAVECFDTVARRSRTFTAAECKFGYRDSFFKHAGKGRYIVMRVSYRLHSDGKARTLHYGPLQSLTDRLGHQPTIKEVADEVVAIRNSKLPDPRHIGSAGSFFKNPVISERLLAEIIKVTGEEIPTHPAGDGLVKLSAAWLIDHAGLKGRRLGGAQVYPTQPLVIANVDNATAQDVADLAETVRREVRRKYIVDLRPEVNYIDTDIKVTVLGSGTSKGIPEIGCHCHVCTSPFEKDKRLRASVLVQTHGMNILIDASPDLREQALRQDIDHLDAVLLTHTHYDHVGGIDDLRPFCIESSLPIYLRKDVADDLHHRIDYCFRDHLYPGVPALELKVIGNTPFYIKGLKVEPIEVQHGKMTIYGYRIGKFAYVTDAKYIDDSEKEKLSNLDVLIVNALREREHFAHFNIAEALELIKEVKPQRAFLTHFCHEAGRNDEITKLLPDNVLPCYDGMTVEIK